MSMALQDMMDGKVRDFAENDGWTTGERSWEGNNQGNHGELKKKTSQLYAICHSWSLEFISYHFSSFMTNFPWLTLLTPLMSSRYFHNDPCCGCGAMWSPKERERWKSGKAMQWTCNVMCSAALMCLGRVLGWQWSLERMKTIENQFVEPCWTIVCPQNVYIYIFIIINIINYVCIVISKDRTNLQTR